MKDEEIPMPDHVFQGVILPCQCRQDIEEPEINEGTLLDALARKDKIIRTLRKENKHLKQGHSAAMREITQLRDRLSESADLSVGD